MAIAAAAHGLVGDADTVLAQIGFRVAILHGIIGTLIPLILICLLTRLFGAERSIRRGLAAWRFALFSAVSMTIPYILAARVLGPEFPSLLGSVAGLIIVISAARRGWFLPSDGVWRFPKETGLAGRLVTGSDEFRHAA